MKRKGESLTREQLGFAINIVRVSPLYIQRITLREAIKLYILKLLKRYNYKIRWVRWDG